MAPPRAGDRRRLRAPVRHQRARPLRAHRPPVRPRCEGAIATPAWSRSSSNAHKMPDKINLEDLQSERGYRRWRAYVAVEAAPISMLALELDRRLRAAARRSRASPRTPAYARRPTCRPRRRPLLERIVDAAHATLLVAQSADMGALPTLYCRPRSPGLERRRATSGPDGIGGVAAASPARRHRAELGAARDEERGDLRACGTTSPRSASPRRATSELGEAASAAAAREGRRRSRRATQQNRSSTRSIALRPELDRLRRAGARPRRGSAP